MSATRHQISNGEHPDLVGLLHGGSGSKGASTKPIALILHGVLAHKDQSYHRLLAQRLLDERGLPSFRYDLRGQGGESEGNWNMANFDDDVQDLERVIAWLKEQGYHIHLLIGHSRGSMITSYFLSTRTYEKIPLWVNVSGRYDMSRILQNRKYDAGFEKLGYWDWNVKIAGKMVSRRITPEGVMSFADWDNSYLQSTFPQDIDVLTIHGDADDVVPLEGSSIPFSYDSHAHTYHKIFSQRRGSSTLIIGAGHGHNWTRPFDEPVNGILSWLSKVDSSTLKSKI